MKDFILRTFYVKPDKWAKYIKLCKDNNTDASKDIRKHIDKQLKCKK